jgi:hypothetical protein
VAGIDPAPYPRAFAARTGLLALDECGQETTEQVLAWSRGRARTPSRLRGVPSDAAVMVPALCATGRCHHRGGCRAAPRDALLRRETSLWFARSYGPGRYDPRRESWGMITHGPRTVDRGTQLRPSSTRCRWLAPSRTW